MRRSILFVIPLLVAGTFAAIQTTGAQNEAERRTQSQKVVVHLSHFTDDLHRCFMALKVANLMQEEGAEVTMFLDLEGVRLAERAQDLSFTWGKDSLPLAEHYDAFQEAGGNVIVCPHCAKAARITDPGLRRNAQIGTPSGMGKLLIDADKVIDY